MYFSVQPPSGFFWFACSTASCAAYAGNGPSVASPPVRGRSVATETVPLHPAIPPPPLLLVVVFVEVPHADSPGVGCGLGVLIYTSPRVTVKFGKRLSPGSSRQTLRCS